jgi:integrase
MPRHRGHVRRRGNRWAAVINLPRGEDGRRRTKWIPASSEREAHRILTKALRELDTQTFNDARGLTFGTYARRWLEEEPVTASWSPTTAVTYRAYLRLYLLPRLGAVKLDLVTPAHLRRLLADLATRGKKGGRAGLGRQTLVTVYRLVGNILAAAVRDELLARNPACAVEAPKAPPPHGQPLTAEMTRRLLAAAGEHGGGWFALLLTALGTGLRRGEIVALRWQEVDLDRGILAVTRAAVQIEGQVIYQAPKSVKGTRRLALPPVVREELVRHKARQAERRLACGGAYEDHDLVFPAANGRPRSLAGFSMGFTEFLKAHDLPHTTFHSLRHTYASQLLSGGVQMYLVSALMGHSSTATTTTIYGHLLGGEAEAAAAQLEGVLRKAVGGQ